MESDLSFIHCMIKNITWNWLHFGDLQCPYPGLHLLCFIWGWKHSQFFKCNHFRNFAFLSRQGIKSGGSDDNNDEDDHDHDDDDVDEDENNGNGKNHDDNDDHNNNNNNNCIL